MFVVAEQSGGVPIVIAGDIFDRWDAPPEIVNAVISALGEYPVTIYAIPGQHDLPHHNYEDMHKSAYWTLIEASVLVSLHPMECQSLPSDSLHMWGFPWGFAPAPPKPEDVTPRGVRLAVVHRYMYTAGMGHPNAAPENDYANCAPMFEGYDAVVVGDNHIPWQAGKVYNHGCFIRRRTDEREIIPGVGILYSDGSIEHRPLDTGGDKWVDTPAAAADVLGLDADELVCLLKTAGDAVPGFRDSLRRAAERPDIELGVRNAILGWLDV